MSKIVNIVNKNIKIDGQKCGQSCHNVKVKKHFNLTFIEKSR